LVEDDSLPLKLLPKLQKKFPEVEFKEFDSAEDLHKEGKDLVVIDAVKGLDKVQVIDNIDSIVLDNIYSLHDFDLGYNLRLMKKIGLLNSVKIFAVPIGVDEEKNFHELTKIIDEFT
jgi:Ni,Fe-hydrogenase maturation factor